MAICYLDGTIGNDANDGSSFILAKKTYSAARSAVAGATPQIIIIVRGYFREGNFGVPSIPNGQWQHNFCLGQCIFDGEGVKTTFSSYGRTGGVIWVGGIFKNYTTDFFSWVDTSGTTVGHYWFNCALINKLGGNSIDVYSHRRSYARFWNCTFINLTIIDYIHVYSSIVYGSLDAGGPNTVAYNASNVSNLRGVGGWNPATFPPPFTDAANDDYTLDSGAAHFVKYRTEGMHGSQVGASGLGGMFYHQDGSGIGLDDHLLGAWQNDDSYYNPAFQQVVVSLGVNDKIDFTDDDGTFAATVAPGTYTDGATLATAVQGALNATASTQIYTCTFSSGVMRYTITNTTGALLSLLWNTGINSGTTIGSDIGYDTSANDIGALSYQSDDAVTIGGVAGTTSVILSGSAFEMDMGIEPAATSARVLGPVNDFGRAVTPKGLFWGASESGASVVDNSQPTSVREIEVRGNSSLFNKTDAGGTTDIDWTMVARGTNMSFPMKRWWNTKVVLRTNGTP